MTTQFTSTAGTAMTFGAALEAMKLGQLVKRAVWRGTPHLRLAPASNVAPQRFEYVTSIGGVLFNLNPVASEADMLSCDWQLVAQ